MSGVSSSLSLLQRSYLPVTEKSSLTPGDNLAPSAGEDPHEYLGIRDVGYESLYRRTASPIPRNEPNR